MRMLVLFSLLVGCVGKETEDVSLAWSAAPEPVTLSTSYATSKIVGSGELAVLNEDTLELLLTPLAFDGEGAELLQVDLEPYQKVKVAGTLNLTIDVTDEYSQWKSGDYQANLLVEVQAFSDTTGTLEDPEVIGPESASIPVQFAIVCDEDGDGADSDACLDGTDCDDTDADLGPSVPELCDGIDNDCDGETDEAGATDQATWFQDLDRDDYGDAFTTTSACEQPDGYVADSSDCDDLSGNVYPGADELCDEIDNDCDGEIDELGATDAQSWYADTDGDAQGDPDADIQTCDRPEGYVDNADDCDDGDDTIYKGAEEVCDEADNDCDDKVDEGLDCGTDTGAP